MIQFRRGTTSSWNKTKTKLAPGQPGYDKDKNQLKIGDGEHTWSELPCVGVAADTVIDTGSSGDWTYQKWESGIARCWCTKEVLVTLSTAIGTTGLFQDNGISTISYPIEFTSAPCETTTIQSSNGIVWLATKSKNTSSVSGEYIIISTTAQELPAKYLISIQAEGHWK
jgi:hypothetical protein